MFVNIPTFTTREECVAFATDRQARKALGETLEPLVPNTSVSFTAVEHLVLRDEGDVCCSFPAGAMWLFIPMSRTGFLQSLQQVLAAIQRRQQLTEGIASGKLFG